MKKKDYSVANTCSNSNVAPPIVCAYACIPQWEEENPVVFDDWASTIPKNKDVDTDEVLRLASEIVSMSKQAGKLDELFEMPNNHLRISYNFNDDKWFEVFQASSGEEVAHSIVELLKGYYEIEIEKKRKELIECLK